MGWFRKKKKTEGIKDTSKKPVAVKILDFFHSIGGTPVPPSVLEHYGLTDSFKQSKYIQEDLTDGFTVIKKSATFYTTKNIYELVIVQKKLYIRKEYVTDFRRLSPEDIQNWLGRCGATYNGLTWRQVTTEGISCHSVSPENLYSIIHNVFDGNFRNCQSTGAFTNEELRKIFPEYDRLLTEAKLKAEEQAEQERLEREWKVIEKKIDRKERLSFEEDKIRLRHRLDKELNPQEEEKKPKKKKMPTYDEDSRLANIGLILDSEGVSIGHPLKFDLDKIIPKHIAVVGAIGNGKSVTAYDIAEEVLSYKIPVLVIDPTDRWTGFLKECTHHEFISKYSEFGMKKPKSFSGKVFAPSTNFGTPLKTNLLAKPNTDDSAELHTLAEELVGLIEDFCGSLKKDALRVEEKIIKSWIPDKDEQKEKEKGVLNYEKLREEFSDDEDAHRRLRKLEQAPFLFDGPRLDDISDIWEEGEISVIATAHLDPKIQSFVAYYILRELLNYFRTLDPVDTKPEKIRLLLVLEEAHEFKEKIHVRKTIERIARTLRKQGVGVLFVTQRFVDLEEAQAYVNTKIYMRTFSRADIDRASIDLGTEFANEILPTLETGSGIFASPDFGQPVHVKFRPCYHSPDSIDLREL